MDNHATTRLDPRVVEAMVPFFIEAYGNAASANHDFGEEAKHAVDKARSQVAALINAEPREIVFCSGATEANNLALKGVISAAEPRNHLIVNAAEHRSILDTALHLEEMGCEVTVLPVDRYGIVCPQDVADSSKANTVLVSVMTANNEVGSLNRVAEIGEICRSRNVLLHTDATQAVGKIPIDVVALSVDLMSFSAHKLYGPKGVGALYVRRGYPPIKIRPLLHGGGHESGLRSGTLPVPLIVGMGMACEICRNELHKDDSHTSTLRNRLLERITERLEDVESHGHPTERLPGSASITFNQIPKEVLISHLREIVAVSFGSACTSASSAHSHVLAAMGVPHNAAESTVRFGIGRFNTDEEVDVVVNSIAALASRYTTRNLC
jgi:cysteine desulfurase